MDEIRTGIENEITRIVKEKDTASAYGSGNVNVFATPAMIALMEETALKSVEPFLEESKTTVGFEVNVKHFKGVKVGEKLVSRSKLVEANRKKLVFEVEVFHEGDTVGKGGHIRYLVDKKMFV